MSETALTTAQVYQFIAEHILSLSQIYQLRIDCRYTPDEGFQVQVTGTIWPKDMPHPKFIRGYATHPDSQNIPMVVALEEAYQAANPALKEET